MLMKKSQGLFILAFFLSLYALTFVSALCESGQIDVNTASSSELDKIIGVGNATALKIIATRPFSSVDDLIRVSGIGNVTLSKMKAQGLVCVGDEEDTVKEEIQEETNVTEVKVISDLTNTQTAAQPESKKAITLNPQVIKTAGTNGLKKSPALWGFVVFCVLIVVLFIIKAGKYKNEFR